MNETPPRDEFIVRAEPNALVCTLVETDGSAIPLNDIPYRLAEYFNNFGPEDKINVQIVYRNESGILIPWNPSSSLTQKP